MLVDHKYTHKKGNLQNCLYKYINIFRYIQGTKTRGKTITIYEYIRHKALQFKNLN